MKKSRVLLPRQDLICECPKCGGALSGDEMDVDSRMAWRKVSCQVEGCGWSYTECYEFTHNENDGGILIDTHGNETGLSGYDVQVETMSTSEGYDPIRVED